ncbi:ABC transporter ATP-binding protein [Desulfosporosinus fructosivorans]|uniref:ABC transporter ATP-binding protein n=1 Tax=Desulfosporosinus fructosivorans TaxID=2018669 RepID=A0A4Z0R9T2_9FIRM|nr:ABC transporter ATP-binding protein [Desulfosporosinus fructosivorans]TGE38366.1 ABC transporter ATP-binding protein [Desulfosporosinus fructosivorans]
MSEIITVENLTVAFGKHKVLDSLSMGVQQGEVLGVIGPNGAGKTTLLNTLSGRIKPQGGRIVYQGIEITRVSPAQRCRMGIGRTYQVPCPFENLTVYENILVGGVHGAGFSERKARDKCLEILSFTGIAEKRDILAGKLTLMDRKRLEVARALATNPKVLLLDEVAAGLTEVEVKAVMQIVENIKNMGVTIIWIEHILKTMLEATDQLMCLAEGKNITCGVPQEILASKLVEEVYLGVEDA